MSLDVVRFEDFELDVRRYALRRDGRSLKLERIPMELLRFLVERRGELVTREEIIDKLWGKDVFLDTDNSINTAIRKIRQALRDDPEHPRFVLTIAGKGYRFIAPVTEVRPDAAREGPTPPSPRHPITLTSGQTVSHYRILREIGKGGMGVVYEAEDTRLGRRVAMKVLAEKLKDGEKALARFLREARAASSLSHPNICTIYEIEEHEGRPVMIMELLTGETLKEFLRRGHLNSDQWYSTGRQLADALSAAHAKGIIHRDIKPANIFITKNGPVKVLDFGLAKLTAGHAVPTEDLEDPLTNTGVLPGTTPYMSPEQVRGEELDCRSDLFSLGVVLYEAATGHKPFTGKSTLSVMDAILNSQPAPANSVTPELGADVEQIVGKALQKNRDCRYQTAAELRSDLDEQRKLKPSLPRSDVPVDREFPVARFAIWCLALLIVAVSVLWLTTRHRTMTRIHGPAEWVQLTHFSDAAQEPVLSSDGRMLAFLHEKSLESTIPFVAAGQIDVMLLPDGEPQPVTRDDLPKGMIAFSPDGSRLAYTVPSSWDTWVVPSVGGDSQLLLANASGLSWIGRERFLFSEVKAGVHMGIVTAGENRRDVREIYTPPTQSGMAHLSHISPDQKWVLISGEMDANGFLPCRLVPFEGRSSGHLVGPPGERCFYAAWSPDGLSMYFGADSATGMHIFRQAFPDGRIVQLTFGPTEEKGLSIAPDGRSLITAVTSDERRVWIHRPSGEQPISSDGFTGAPSFSRDGKKLFYLWRSTPLTGGFFAGELRSTEIDSGKTERLLPGVEMEDYALSGDSSLLVFTIIDKDRRTRLWIAPRDGRSAPRQLTLPNAADESNPNFGPQGDIFFDSSEDSSIHMFRVHPDGTGRQRVRPEPVIATSSLSPDGKWLVARVQAYGREATDATVAYPIGAGAPVRLCSPECYVGWSSDGSLLYMTPAGIGGMKAQNTYAIPLERGKMFPAQLSVAGIRSESDLAAMIGAEKIQRATISPGPNPEIYAFVSAFHRSNLYRIPID